MAVQTGIYRSWGVETDAGWEFRRSETHLSGVASQATVSEARVATRTQMRVLCVRCANWLDEQDFTARAVEGGIDARAVGITESAITVTQPFQAFTLVSEWPLPVGLAVDLAHGLVGP